MQAKLVLLTALAFGAAAVHAQTPVAIPVSGDLKAALEAAGDPARGRAAFEDCAGCHRKNAAGRANGSIPRLSGQHASVIVKQLVDIRSGLRNNPPMKPFVDDPTMSPQVFADIASYLQTLPVIGTLGKGPGSGVARGKALYERDCVACHRANGEGDAATFAPALAAQHYAYLVRELGQIRDDSRGNSNPAMAHMVKSYTAADLEAVADYLAQLPPPKR